MTTETKGEFTRKTWCTPAFHRVEEGYGVHGVDIHFVLIGPKGAVNWAFSTGVMLEKTYEWWQSKGLHLEPNRKDWMGFELRYHSPKPLFEGQTAHKEGCEWIGTPCYTDAGFIMGGDMEGPFVEKGDEWVWTRLEEHYNDTFND